MKFLRTRAMQIAIDGFVVLAALALAYGIRFEGIPPRIYTKQFFLMMPYVVLLRLGLFTGFGVYRLMWRYVSLRDLPRLLASVFLGSLIIVLVRFAVGPVMTLFGFPLNSLFATIPYGILLAEFFLTTIGILTARVAWRMLVEWSHQRRTRHRPNNTAVVRVKRRALLVGAGSAGVMVAREVSSRPDVGFEIVGFLDDNPIKHGTIIHGYRVIGSTELLPQKAKELHAELVVITMASAPASAIRRIVGLAEAASLKVQITPGLYEILSGRVGISKIRDVAIEDLLGRAPVQLEETAISQFLNNKTVLITGAGGSIGSEICRQVSHFGPAKLVMVDQAENPLFHIHRELEQSCPGVPLVPVIASVVHRDRMRQIMQQHQPQVVFHAAAHKHVPLMEANPSEAIRNNVLGSCTVADLTHEMGAEALVMISTDKAVNPTSVMGVSKRVAEMYVQALATTSKTRFLTVRFGNVLDSEGSVVPIFREQIRRGGPVTVTHPEMKRYFMLIPEAAQLVLQAATMGKHGEIFILEMGEPILIANLARDLIRLSGYRPDEDIRITYTGIRPGEKLYEEINLSEENATKTRHPRIWIGNGQSADFGVIKNSVDVLVKNMGTAAPEQLRRLFSQIVPEYQPVGGVADSSSDLESRDLVASTSFETRPRRGRAAEAN